LFEKKGTETMIDKVARYTVNIGSSQEKTEHHKRTKRNLIVE